MRTTRVLAIIAILGIAFSFRASANVVYDSETTNTWFSVDMSKLTTDALKSSPWESPSPDGEAVVDHSVIKLDTDLDDSLTYTAEASADVAIVAAEMTATVNASVPDLVDVPQAALCVIGTASATNWVGLVGDENGGTNWVTFSTPVPVAGETYSVRIEFDQRQGLPRRIRYRVGDAVLGDGWYPNPQKTVEANIKSISFSGTGDISGLGGSNVVENAATFGGIGYATFDAALDAAKTQGSGWSDAKPIILYKDKEYSASQTEKLYIDANGRVFTIIGSVAIDQNGNEYSITAGDECEAKIGDKYYSTIENAIAAAMAGQTITVNTAIKKALTFGNTSVTLDTNDKTVTCAKLTVASGVTLTLDDALAVTDAAIAGSVAGATLTVNGTLSGTSITSLTLGNNATFAYEGAPLAAATLGTALSVTGLSQAEVGATIINSVTADSTTFTSDLPTGKCLEVADGALKVASVVEIDDLKDVEGFDYTNGTVNVTATVKSGTAEAVLTVVGWDGTTVKTATKDVTSGTTMTWEVADVMEGALTQGGVYTYTVDIKIDDDVVATKSGEFTAAKWGNIWFGADASKDEGLRVVNGTWETAPSVDSADKVYVIEEDSVFNVDVGKQDLGSNRVTRVDAKVTYESLVDGEVDVPANDAISGFVATTGGWMALANGNWVLLSGSSDPIVDVSYVIRAEVDFISTPKRVRYLVSEDDGATFFPLSYGTSQWIDLVAQDKSLLAQVELQGSGKLAKFEARIADKAIAIVDGTEYDSMEDALEAAKDNGKAITLLTNATIEPDSDKPGKYEIAPNNHQYVSGGKVSDTARAIIVDGSGNPPVVRPTDAEMQKVMTPDGQSYKNYDSLRKFLERNKVEGYTKDDANADSVSNALETVDAGNNLKYWQDYALGIDVGTSVAPVTKPAGDTDVNNITLAIPAVEAATPSDDYTIKYQVTHGMDSIDQEGPNKILIPLEHGTGTYKIKVVFTPAN